LQTILYDADGNLTDDQTIATSDEVVEVDANG
jgi:hypothetical protein